MRKAITIAAELAICLAIGALFYWALLASTASAQDDYYQYQQNRIQQQQLEALREQNRILEQQQRQQQFDRMIRSYDPQPLPSYQGTSRCYKQSNGRLWCN